LPTVEKYGWLLLAAYFCFGISPKKKPFVDSYQIVFSTTSFLEYFLRVEESYTRESVTMYWLRNCGKADDVIIDIGANVGVYSLLLGKIVQNGNGIVYAIEPESGNYSVRNKILLLTT